MNDVFDQLLTWSDPGYADDDRARFALLHPGGGSTNLMLRNLRFAIDRAGNKDWTVEHTDEAGHVWSARSDTATGAVLNLLARMCGLGGEIRGFLPSNDEETTK